MESGIIIGFYLRIVLNIYTLKEKHTKSIKWKGNESINDNTPIKFITNELERNLTNLNMKIWTNTSETIVINVKQKADFTWKAKVYQIECKQCPLIFMGEQTRDLNKRS